MSAPECPQPGKYIVHRFPGGIAHSCPEYRMAWQGKEYRLDWHPRCGPSLLKRNGDPYADQPGENHPFWDGIAAWQAAGHRADETGACIMKAAP